MVNGPSFSGWRNWFEFVHIAPCHAKLFIVVMVILFTFRATGQTVLTERMSVSTEGTQGNNASFNPSISSDGRYVAFESVAGNLVAGDGNRRRDIFVHDRQSGATERVSVTTAGGESNGDSFNPSISSDGRYVAFESVAGNLVAGDGNGGRDIFVHDRQSGATERVSLTTASGESNGESFNPSISGDGQFVAFESTATNLIGSDTNGRRDIFVHNRQSGETKRVSVSTSGAQSNGDSFKPSISGDGQFVAFESTATNLIGSDTNRRRDIFVHNRQTAETERVSVSTDGSQGNGDSSNPSLNSDGRYVAFDSVATNLVEGDTNNRKDVFVRDRQKTRTTRESVAGAGIQANDSSDSPSINAAGDVVTFASLANNLVLGDSNQQADIFVHEPTQLADLIAQGERIFFNETFEGNGRTCGTCHPAENKLTIDPAFIAQLPADDPLFVAEFNPDLADLENPRLLREFGLIRENLDGFDQPGVMRGVPHTRALSTSVLSFSGPRTGWSGDGSPDNTLRSFTTGAVFQHFTKTLNRLPGVDFRLPTDDELDAVEAFMLSTGRQSDLSLPLPLKGTVPIRGQEIFLDNSLGKCNICHVNAGASLDLGFGNLGNFNFNTGVEDLPDQPARLTGEIIPIDGGLGRTPRPSGGFGDGSFNTPPLVEAADTPPFFHNNSVLTLEEAVAFYNSPEFNSSQASRDIGGTISLSTTQVQAVAAFLRVINVLENIRSAIDSQEKALLTKNKQQAAHFLILAGTDIDSAISVLDGGGLHPDAVMLLEDAKALIARRRFQGAIDKEKAARDLIVEPS